MWHSERCVWDGGHRSTGDCGEAACFSCLWHSCLLYSFLLQLLYGVRSEMWMPKNVYFVLWKIGFSTTFFICGTRFTVRTVCRCAAILYRRQMKRTGIGWSSYYVCLSNFECMFKSQKSISRFGFAAREFLVRQPTASEPHWVSSLHSRVVRDVYIDNAAASTMHRFHLRLFRYCWRTWPHKVQIVCLFVVEVNPKVVYKCNTKVLSKYFCSFVNGF